MMVAMTEIGHQTITISCDECSMQCTDACQQCVVSYVLRREDIDDEPLVLDLQEARVVRMLSRAGLVPELLFQDVG